jgi:enamine deaminase RidA (YjgF/YER057c/UK114 family)
MHSRINQSPAMTFPGMAQAVRVGDTIVLSGQVAFDETGALVGEGDAATQAEQCFVNIERLLEQAGASLADVVKLTCFLADVSAYAGYAEAKLRRFPAEGPAGTAVVVARLLDERLLMEVEAMAVVGR